LRAIKSRGRVAMSKYVDFAWQEDKGFMRLVAVTCELGTKKFPRQRLSHSKQFPHWPNLTLSPFVNSIHHQIVQIGGYLCSIRQFAYHFKVKSWKISPPSHQDQLLSLMEELIHMHVNCNVFLAVDCLRRILDNTLKLQSILVVCGVGKFILGSE
jgi:hypothetical protein